MSVARGSCNEEQGLIHSLGEHKTEKGDDETEKPALHGNARTCGMGPCLGAQWTSAWLVLTAPGVQILITFQAHQVFHEP